MPFTFSHPAIVLPLTYLPRQWFSLTGLVIGSVTPDFEYFLRMRIQSDYSHTIGGVFWFNLPMGLLLTFVFHNIVRNSLFENLPKMLKSKVLKFQAFDWNLHFKRNWMVVIVSILIGAASHIFWDSFTHDNGYFVQTLQILKTNLVVMEREIPIFKVLQHSSTLLGGLAIAIAVYRLPTDKSVTSQGNSKYWPTLTLLTLMIIVIRLFSGLNYKLFGHIIVTAISAGVISLILTAWLIDNKKVIGGNSDQRV